MLEIAEHFGANSSVNKNYVSEIQNVLELEMELVKAALEDKSFEYMMAEDFIKLYPGFPIVFFVRARYQEYFDISAPRAKRGVPNKFFRSGFNDEHFCVHQKPKKRHFLKMLISQARNN